MDWFLFDIGLHHETRKSLHRYIQIAAYVSHFRFSQLSQPAITCSKLTIETLEQGVKYVQICEISSTIKIPERCHC